MAFDDKELPTLPNSFNIPPTNNVARVVDDELAQLGWSENARVSFLGNVGRENSWDMNTIFKGHKDPKNGADNFGIISWQGSRRKDLVNYLKENGGDFTPSEKNLRLMTKFADWEMNNSKDPRVADWKKTNAKLKATNTPLSEASKGLDKYIQYAFTDKSGKVWNTPDTEYGSQNNRVWAEKAKQMGLGRLPDLPNFSSPNQPITKSSNDPNNVERNRLIFQNKDLNPASPEAQKNAARILELSQPQGGALPPVNPQGAMSPKINVPLNQTETGYQYTGEYDLDNEYGFNKTREASRKFLSDDDIKNVLTFKKLEDTPENRAQIQKDFESDLQFGKDVQIQSRVDSPTQPGQRQRVNGQQQVKEQSPVIERDSQGNILKATFQPATDNDPGVVINPNIKPKVVPGEATQKNIARSIQDGFAITVIKPKNRDLTVDEVRQQSYARLPAEVRGAFEAYKQITGNDWLKQGQDTDENIAKQLQKYGESTIQYPISGAAAGLIQAYQRNAFAGVSELLSGAGSGVKDSLQRGAVDYYNTKDPLMNRESDKVPFGENARIRNETLKKLEDDRNSWWGEFKEGLGNFAESTVRSVNPNNVLRDWGILPSDRPTGVSEEVGKIFDREQKVNALEDKYGSLYQYERKMKNWDTFDTFEKAARYAQYTGNKFVGGWVDSAKFVPIFYKFLTTLGGYRASSPVEENDIYKSLELFKKKYITTDDYIEGSTSGEGLSAAASALQFAAGGALFKGSPRLATALLGIATQVPSMYEDMRRRGISPEQALFWSNVAGYPLGALELAGLNGRLAKLFQATALGASVKRGTLSTILNYGKTYLKEGFDGGIDEFFQEGLQTTTGAALLESLARTDIKGTRRLLEFAYQLPIQTKKAVPQALTAAVVGFLFGGTASTISQAGQQYDESNFKHRRNLLANSKAKFNFDEININGEIFQTPESVRPTLEEAANKVKEAYKLWYQAEGVLDKAEAAKGYQAGKSLVLEARGLMAAGTKLYTEAEDLGIKAQDETLRLQQDGDSPIPKDITQEQQITKQVDVQPVAEPLNPEVLTETDKAFNSPNRETTKLDQEVKMNADQQFATSKLDQEVKAPPVVADNATTEQPKTTLEGRSYFDPKQIESASNQSSGSRETLIDMPIDDFLTLVDKLPVPDKSKQAKVKQILKSGKPFNQLPTIRFDGKGKVVSHEGRHRALALKEAGATTIPVVITSDKIRWGKQAVGEQDRVSSFPKTLISQDSSTGIPFPFALTETGTQVLKSNNVVPTNIKAIDQSRIFKEKKLAPAPTKTAAVPKARIAVAPKVKVAAPVKTKPVVKKAGVKVVPKITPTKPTVKPKATSETTEIDEIIARQKARSEAKEEVKVSTKAAATSIKNALEEVIKGAVEASKPSGGVGLGLPFHDGSYRRMKVHLVKAFNELKLAGQSAVNISKALRQYLDNIGIGPSQIKAYIDRFVKDVTNRESRKQSEMEGGNRSGLPLRMVVRNAPDAYDLRIAEKKLQNIENRLRVALVDVMPAYAQLSRQFWIELYAGHYQTARDTVELAVPDRLDMLEALKLINDVKVAREELRELQLQVAAAALNVDKDGVSRPPSRYTLKVLNDRMFADKEGKRVKKETIQQVLKQSSVKKIEADIINATLAQPQFQDGDSVDFSEFKRAVTDALLPLKVIETSTYANYGLEHVGLSGSRSSTHIYNTDLEHGHPGHFSGDFARTQATDWVIREVTNPDTNAVTFLTVREGVTLTQENIATNVGTATSTREQAEDWLNTRTDSQEVNKGLFGHARIAEDGLDTHLTEAQSDSLQKHAAEIMVLESYFAKVETGTLSRTDPLYDSVKELKDIGTKLFRDFGPQVDVKERFQAFEFERAETAKNREALAQLEMAEQLMREFAQEVEAKMGATAYLEPVWSYGNILEQVVQRLLTQPSSKYSSVPDIFTVEAIKPVVWIGVGTPTDTIFGVVMRELARKSAVNGGTIVSQYMQFQDKIKSRIRDFEAEEEGLRQAVKAPKYKKFQELQELEKKLRKQIITNFPLKYKQFIAHRKNYTVRLLREEINTAAVKGQERLLIPTPRTAALIEGFLDANGANGLMPYMIVSTRDHDYLSLGDIIRYEGDDYTVVESDWQSITVAPSDEVLYENYEDWVDGEIDFQVDNIRSELSDYEDKWLTSQAIHNVIHNVISWDESLNLGDYLEESLGESDSDPEYKVNWDSMKDAVTDIVSNNINETSFYHSLNNLYDHMWSDDHEGYYVGSHLMSVETFGQPGNYSSSDINDFSDFEQHNFSSTQQTVLDKYVELNKLFRKERSDVESVIKNGAEWLATKLTPKDASSPFALFKFAVKMTDEHHAFQKKLNKVNNLYDLVPPTSGQFFIANDDEVKLSLEAGEFFREATSMIHRTNINSEANVMGQFLDPVMVTEYIQALESLAHYGARRGYDVRPVKDLATALDRASLKNGTVRINIFDDATIHERGHQTGYLAANPDAKSIIKRVGDLDGKGNVDDFTAIRDEHGNKPLLSIIRKANQSFFKHYGLSLDTLAERAVIVEEIWNHSQTGDGSVIGITAEEEATFQHFYMKAFAAKNGYDSLNSFAAFYKEYNLDTQHLEGVRDAVKKQDRIAKKKSAKSNKVKPQKGNANVGGGLNSVSNKTDRTTTGGEKGKQGADQSPPVSGEPSLRKVADAEKAYQEASERLRKKSTQFNSGIDPQDWVDFVTVGVYHLKKGAHKFADWSVAMVESLGERVSPYTHEIWNRIKDHPVYAHLNLEDAPEEETASKTKTSSGYTPDGKIKQSQTPKSLRENEILIENRDYTSATNKGQMDAADIVLNKGVEGATKWFNEQVADNNHNSGLTGVVALNLMRHLGNSGQIDEMNRIADALIPFVTGAAQTVQAMSLVSMFNPVNAGVYAAKVSKQRRGKNLTPEQYKEAVDIAQEMQDVVAAEGVVKAALSQLDDELDKIKEESKDLDKAIDIAGDARIKVDSDLTVVNAEVERLKQQSAELQEEVEAQMRANEVLQRELHATTLRGKLLSMAEGVVARLDVRANEARERLRKKGHGVETQTNARVFYTAGELLDFAHIAAADIARFGLESSKWTDSLLTDFGENVRPYFQQIRERAEKLIKKAEPQVKGEEKTKTKVKQPTNPTSQEKINDLGGKIKERIAEDSYDISYYVRALSRVFIAEGEKTLDGLVDAMHDVLKDVIPDITKRETMDAFTGYGKWQPLPPGEIERIRRDLQGQGRQIAKLQDMAAGKAPLASGREFPVPSAIESELIKQVNEAKKNMPETEEGRGKRLKSALQTRETYLTNRIEELENAKKTSTALKPRNTTTVTSTKIAELENQLAELKKEYAEIFGKKGLTDEQRLKLWDARVQKRLAEYERRLRDKDFTSVPKRPHLTLDATRKLIQLKAKALSDQYKEAKKLANPSENLYTKGVKIVGAAAGYSDEAIFITLARKKFKTVEGVQQATQKHFPDITSRESRQAVRDSNELGREVEQYLTRNRVESKYKTRFTQNQSLLIQKDLNAESLDKRRVTLHANKYFNSISKPTTQLVLEGAISYMKANLLAWIKTHEINLLSNIGFNTTLEAERIPASVVDQVIALKTGRRTVQGISPRALAQSFKNVIMSDETLRRSDVNTGIKEAYYIIRYGDTADHLSKQQLAESNIKDIANPFHLGAATDAYINFIFRALSAEDALFKVYAFRRSLEEQAKAESLNRAGNKMFANKTSKDIYAHLISHPTNLMQEIAKEYASFATYQNDNWISSQVAWVKAKSWQTKTGIEAVIPFDRTITNIVLNVLERATPFGLVKAGREAYVGIKRPMTGPGNPVQRHDRKFRQAIRMDLHEDPSFAKKPIIEQVEAIETALKQAFSDQQQRKVAKIIGANTTGTGIVYLGYTLAAAGLLTGLLNYDRDDRDEGEESKQRRKKGVEDKTLRVPGVGRFRILDDPMSKALVFGATLYEQQALDERKKRQVISSAISAATESVSDTIIEQPHARYLSELLDSGGTLGQTVGGFARRFIPFSAAVNAAGEISDEKQRQKTYYPNAEQLRKEDWPERQAKGLLYSFFGGIPGARTYLPEKQDALPKGDLLQRLIYAADPFNSRPDVPYKIRNAPKSDTNKEMKLEKMEPMKPKPMK